jgi:hypothetical protein
MRTKETDLQEFQLYIGGRPLPAESGATYESANPYTGEPWALVWVELTGGSRDPFVMGLAKATRAPAAEPGR